MQSRHRRTLAAVFMDPVSATIPWNDIEALLVAVGCKVVEEAGSRVKFVFSGKTAAFHGPHTRKVAKQYQVR